MFSLEDIDGGKADLGMWKFEPEPADSIDSTVGKGSGSFGPPVSGGGGVSVRCSGDALYWC